MQTRPATLHTVGKPLAALLTGLLATVAVLFVIVALETGVALGHANQVRSEPAPNSVVDDPPSTVAVWFTEPIEPSLSNIRVLDSRGARVDDGASLVDQNDPTAMSVGLEAVPEGAYTVAWKNVSTVDGHLVRGSFVFSVGQPISGGPVEALPEPLLQSPAEPFLRWLLLLSVLALVGGMVFELVVSRPVLLARGAAEAVRNVGAGLASRTLKLLWLAVGLFLAASIAQLLLQTTIVHEGSLGGAFGDPLKSTLADTEWGNLWIWRVALALGFAATLALGVLDRRLARAEDMGPRQLLVRVAALGFGGAVLWTLSLTSHGAATAGIRSMALFADYVHLLAAAFWIGALLHFTLGLPLVLHSLSPRQRLTCTSAMLPRFSAVAALSVGVLVVTGAFSAWAQVTVIPALATPYGLTLVAKIALVLPLLFLGALNFWWVRPRLARNDDATPWLRRFLLGEALVAVLVLAAVAVLTSLEPARQVAAREGKGVSHSLVFSDTVEGTAMTLEIEPAQVGPNDLSVALRDRLGNPIANTSEVSLRLSYLDADLGEEVERATAVGDGKFVLEGSQLGIAGPWQAELLVRRPDAFDARTAFRFEVGAAGAGGSASIALSPDTASLFLGAGLALLGMLFMGSALPLGGWFTRAGAGVMVPGAAGFLAGMVLLANVQLFQGGEALRNPFPPTPESLEAGMSGYGQNCQVCHGPSGRGDGPAGAGLDPPPADLVVHVPLHAEQDLFRFVRDGIPGTAMAPLGDTLADEEIWHVVNYIKTFEE